MGSVAYLHSWNREPQAPIGYRGRLMHDEANAKSPGWENTPPDESQLVARKRLWSRLILDMVIFDQNGHKDDDAVPVVHGIAALSELNALPSSLMLQLRRYEVAPSDIVRQNAKRALFESIRRHLRTSSIDSDT